MKTLLLLLSVSMLIVQRSSGLYAQSNLNVIIKNIKNDKGNILVGLYDKASGFPRHVKEGKIVKVTETQMKVTFPDMKPGNYAISVLHDENQNKDLDQTRLGKPREGFGFSNDAMGMIGPPTFKKARIAFKGKEDMDVTINLKYLK